MKLRPLYGVYALILAGYGYIGREGLYSNNFALYFVIGALLFLFSSMAFHLANFLFAFAEGDENHLLSFLQDIASGMAGGLVIAVLNEFKGSSLTSFSYWFGIPAAIAIAMLFLVILGIPYIDMARLKEGKETKSELIKEEIKEKIDY